MFDAATAVQEAAFKALDVQPITSLGAQVWSHAPEIGPADDPLATGEIVLVHDISLTPEGGKDGGLDRASFVIVTLARKPDRAVLSRLQSAVRSILEAGPFTAAGAELSTPVLRSAESQLMEDGETYQGTQIFETLVQPA